MGNHRSGGRNRKPTALKVLEGSFRKSRHKAEMQVPNGWPAPPEWLSAREIALWEQLRGQCEAWVAPSDWSTVLGAVSVLEAILKNREAQAANGGEAGKPLAYTVKVDADGSPVMEAKENPLITQYIKLWAALRPFISSLGLSPVDRAKVHAKPEEPATDKWAGILK